MSPTFCCYFRNLLLFCAISLLLPVSTFSQASQPTSIENLLNLQEPKPKTLFAVIPFKYQGMTENSAVLFGKRFSENLKNINRFESVSPEKIIEFLSDANPDLLSCSDIGCGMTIARMFSARYYVSTDMFFRNNRFQISMNVVDVANGKTVYKINRTESKDNIYNAFFDFTRQIHENIPIDGLVLGAGKRKVVINIGSNDGLKLNDKVVIYNNELLNFYDPRTDAQISAIEYTTPKTQDEGIIEAEEEETVVEEVLNVIEYDNIKAALSVIEITRIESDKSEGLVKITRNIDIPAEQKNQVRFYVNKFRQIQLYENARREIDQYQGWSEEPFKKPFVKKIVKPVEPPVIVPIPLPIIERNEWIHKVRHWEGERNFFQYMLIGSLALGLYTFYSYDAFNAIQLLPIGLTAYNSYALLYSRAELNQLIEEGKFKGYIRTIGDSYLDPKHSPDYSPGISIGYNFDF